MYLRSIQALVIFLLSGGAMGFAPLSPKKVALPAFRSEQVLLSHNLLDSYSAKQLDETPSINSKQQTKRTSFDSPLLIFLPAFVTLCASLPADAATTGGGGLISSALVAYVHYVSLLVMTACVTTERILVKPGMSQSDQALLSNTDIVYGISGLTLAISGYYRVVAYGKGFEFYAHEPVFWLKIALVGILGALSFFPTTIIIQRAVAARQSPNGEYTEMSETLASRLTKILNAELTALASIPLTATIMSRGIGYNENFPWPIEAAGAAVVFLGLGYKYVKEALDFED